jgi:hypothetical protein
MLNALRCANGQTPLHTAYINFFGKETARLLLDAGADPATRDNNGKTPLEMARREWNTSWRMAGEGHWTPLDAAESGNAE